MIELLKQFCHPVGNEYRKNIQEPFSLGDFSYSTDGIIAVRVVRLPDVEENTDAPNISSLDWYNGVSHDFASLPEFDESNIDECKECKGSGKRKECPECGGFGEVEFVNGYNTYDCECKSCEGEGEVSGDANEDVGVCDYCHGTGKNMSFSLEWGAGLIKAGVVKKLSTLPGVELSKTGDGIQPWYFKFDGGDGLVASMRG